MNENTKTLKQLKKAACLVNRTYHKNGPKSFKRGLGALLKVLKHAGGTMTSRELIEKLSYDRPTLKDVVKKAERKGLVTISKSDDKKTYTVALTDEGTAIAEKRGKAQADTTDKIVSVLSEDELAELNAITEKLIVNCKELGAHGKRKNTKKHKGHGRGHGHCHAHAHKHHGGKCHKH